MSETAKKVYILGGARAVREALAQALEKHGLSVSFAVQNGGDSYVAVLLPGAREDTPFTPERILRADFPLRAGDLVSQVLRLFAANESRITPATLGRWMFDPQRNLLTNTKTGDQSVLTEKEAAILQRLLKAKGAAVDRGSLLADVWGYAEGLETHTLETHIYRLRQKLEADPANPVLLVTEDNGYALRP